MAKTSHYLWYSNGTFSFKNNKNHNKYLKSQSKNISFFKLEYLLLVRNGLSSTMLNKNKAKSYTRLNNFPHYFPNNIWISTRFIYL